jgi:hypothetical protein
VAIKDETPFTVGHKLGIVSIHSYTAMLKPSRTTAAVRVCVARALKPTVGFFVVLQISERVKAHIAMKRHMRPTDASEMANAEILRHTRRASTICRGEPALVCKTLSIGTYTYFGIW